MIKGRPCGKHEKCFIHIECWGHQENPLCLNAIEYPEFSICRIDGQITDIYVDRIKIFKKTYNHLPPDEVLIKHEKDGMRRTDIAKMYGVNFATVSRKYSKMRRLDND